MSDYLFSAWAEQNLRVHSRNGSEWVVFCFNNPAHQESNPSCSFNVEEGVWYCFSCGDKGSLKNDDEFDDSCLQRDILKARLAKMIAARDAAEEEETVVPESSLRRYKIKNDFWASRGLNEDTQEMFNLGFDTIANAGTIPLRTPSGALIGVTRRFVDPDSVGTKYKYPRHFKAAQNVFASWMADEYDMSTVVKTEGSIDAMRCWQVGYPAVALYGNSVSPTHLRTLLEMGVKKFIDFSDNDQGGKNSQGAFIRLLGKQQRSVRIQARD